MSGVRLLSYVNMKRLLLLIFVLLATCAPVLAQNKTIEPTIVQGDANACESNAALFDYLANILRDDATVRLFIVARLGSVRWLLMKPKYEKIEELSQAEIEAAVLRDNPNELFYAVLSAALYSEDSAWAKDVCVRLAAHEHYNVRGNAILGFAHIAHIDKKLDEAKVKPLIEAALEDKSEYVRGQAENAKDNIKFYLRWRFRRKKKQSA